MNFLQILLPDRICMILREASPAWEQGGVRRLGGERSPRPTPLGLGCAAATRARSGPHRVSFPRAALRGRLPTPPVPLALAPLPHSGTLVLVAPGAGRLPFPEAQRPPGELRPGRDRRFDGRGRTGRGPNGRCPPPPCGDSVARSVRRRSRGPLPSRAPAPGGARFPPGPLRALPGRAAGGGAERCART